MGSSQTGNVEMTQTVFKSLFPEPTIDDLCKRMNTKTYWRLGEQFGLINPQGTLMFWYSLSSITPKGWILDGQTDTIPKSATKHRLGE